ncbi:hypothetical protein [Polyangium jinanense]|uniref:Lipoprotein n=1 Tax=Polyangium jinanense TaxID=2829994 RepID=A0A9X3WY94_9BACT|nr:hypothetical protein [Polyangium jinanense]MDC3952914.1 hypothetical protein [Polyangium jinanense]MDC3980532.1 hypothetical protein [Polyangium jinanense]
MTKTMQLTMLGAAALMTLGVGCGRGEKPAQSAQQRPTPAFEAAVPAEQGQAGQYGQGQAGQWGQGQAGQGQGQAGQGQAGQGQAQGQAGQWGQGMGMMSEQEMCSSFVQHSNLRVEDIEGGVAIIATPKSGVDLSTLRGDALHIAYTMSPPAGEQRAARPTSASERCALFDLGQTAGRSGVMEQANEIRIILLAQDTTGVPALRNQARGFVRQWGQEGVQSGQGGQPQNR